MRLVLNVGLSIAIASLATGCSSSTFATEKCGSPAAIVGGTDAPPFELAAYAESVVAVLVTDPADSRSVLATCTGVRLDESRVLTARHCVSGSPASAVRVISGPTTDAGTECPSPAASDGVEATAVATSGSLDLAVIRTGPSTGSTAPPCTQLPSVGTPGIIAGYGLAEGGLLGVRHFLETEVVSTAGDVIAVQARSAAGACVGDSGGPLFVKQGDQWCVAGALSTGSIDCRGLDRYQSIASSVDWILSVER
jgi:hypothetical protein